MVKIKLHPILLRDIVYLGKHFLQKLHDVHFMKLISKPPLLYLGHIQQIIYNLERIFYRPKRRVQKFFF